MGVSKRPACNCSDELIPVEVEVIDDLYGSICKPIIFLIVFNTFKILKHEFFFSVFSVDLTVNSATTSNISADESDYEIYPLAVALVGSTAYYRILFSELRTSHNVGINNTDGIKLATFKKNNISQMGRRKANRAQNGIHTYLYLLGCLQSVKYPMYCEYRSS